MTASLNDRPNAVSTVSQKRPVDEYTPAVSVSTQTPTTASPYADRLCTSVSIAVSDHITDWQIVTTIAAPWREKLFRRVHEIKRYVVMTRSGAGGVDDPI